MLTTQLVMHSRNIAAHDSSQGGCASGLLHHVQYKFQCISANGNELSDHNSRDVYERSASMLRTLLENTS